MTTHEQAAADHATATTVVYACHACREIADRLAEAEAEVSRLKAAVQAAYAAGQRDMQWRAIRCCGFDVYNLGNCIRMDIEALAILPMAEQPEPGEVTPP